MDDGNDLKELREAYDEIARLQKRIDKALKCLTHRDQKPSWPLVKAAIHFLRGER